MGGAGMGGGGGNPLLQNPELMAQMMQVRNIGFAINEREIDMLGNLIIAVLITSLPTHTQSPMFQQTMQSMASNPQLMEQMMQNNPMFAGNPRAAEMVSQLCYTSNHITSLFIAGQTSITDGEDNS